MRSGPSASTYVAPPGPTVQPRSPEPEQPATPTSLARPRPGSLGGAPERRSRRRRLGNGRESALLFLIFYAIYATVGCWLVLDKHVIVLDGASRLAHAYFAWYSAPPKLAAIGFEWPPMMTLVLLPLAAIKPLATSFAALPLTSALFGAGILVILNRILSSFAMRPLLRYPLVLLFGANPMIAFYATNGMAESAYLFFLAAGVYFLLCWHRNGHSHVLGMAGAAMALAALSRYEMGVFAAVIGLGVLAILAQRRLSRQEVSGTLILYTAPIAYGVGAWCFFNWLIIGNPFNWLQHQLEANTSQQVAAQQAHVPMSLVQIAEKVLSLNAHLFPLTVVVVPALLLAFVLRRDVMALILAALTSLNALTTIYLINSSGNPGLFQLRYNMRAIPLALIGAGWLFWLLRDRIARGAIWAATLAVLVVGLPITWHTMAIYPWQFQEEVFLQTLKTGKDQGPTDSAAKLVSNFRAASDYVLAHVTRLKSILTDDAQTYGVMLTSGRPDLFYDRIDHGDKRWRRVLRSPYGKVEYVLVAGSSYDNIHACYPRIFAATMPGMQLVYQNADFKLLRVARHPPRNPIPPASSPRCPLSTG